MVRAVSQPVLRKQVNLQKFEALIRRWCFQSFFWRENVGEEEEVNSLNA